MAAITPEQRQQMSERMKVRWAAMSPDERAAYRAKFQGKDKSARARKQLLEFWANCTGEARAKKCAHLTNPEAQAKSHAAQRTPEFLAKKSAWAKAALARKTPEERRAAIEKQGVSCASKRSAEALLGKVARAPSEAASVPDLSGRNAFPMRMGEEAGYSADDDFSTDAEGVAG